MITKEMKIKVFQSFLDTFETEEMKNFCIDVIGELEDYLFMCPASGSGKYHSKQQCEPHGQTIHVLMACKIMNYLLEINYVAQDYNEKQRDILRTAILFHDAKKYGDCKEQKTVHEHPILAANWIKSVKVEHDIANGDKEYIAELISTHSGQWRDSSHSDVVLPKLLTPSECLVHICDYLASRKDLIFSCDKALVSTLNQFTPPIEIPTVEDLKNITKTELPSTIDKMLSGATEHIVQKCKEEAGKGRTQYKIYWQSIPNSGREYMIQKVLNIISEFELKGYTAELIDTSNTDSLFAELALILYWGESSYIEDLNSPYSIYTTLYGWNDNYSRIRQLNIHPQIKTNR